MTDLTPDAQRRKNQPLCTGLLDYFPQALLAVAELSRIANEQHNPGEPMHWAKEKSTDEPDALMRHLIDRGTLDTDGTRHSAKVAWRALALLQREIEAERETLNPVLDPDAQRPDENAKQHRDRVNRPWNDLDDKAADLRDIVAFENGPDRTTAYTPHGGMYSRQPDDFAETSQVQERRVAEADRRKVLDWAAAKTRGYGRYNSSTGRRITDTVDFTKLPKPIPPRAGYPEDTPRTSKR